MSSRAGKTTPRLIQDLLTYDARYEPRAGRNLLTTSPSHYEPGSKPTPAVPLRNCRHEFMIKDEQSVLPKGNPSPGDVYKIASFCQLCRWHVDLLVDLCEDGHRTVPCQQSSGEYTLHHFVFEADETEQANLLGYPNLPRAFRFHCSAPRCPSELRVRIRPPRFNDQYIITMIDRDALRVRLAKARELGGDRADAQMARPVDALDFLSTYLTDALNPQKGKARVPLLNRKFLKTFGKDCDQILIDLGFTHAVEELDDGSAVEAWYLPKPAPAGNALELDTDRTVIEDAQHELGVLISKFPEAERSGVRHPLQKPQSSLKHIERTLGCENYQKRAGSGPVTRSANHEEDHPYYAGLGAIGDFSDSLLLFSYACQVKVDPMNATYYFECLQDLAIGRKSQFLEEQVMLLASQGQSNRQEVASAYRYLGMDPGHGYVLSDDVIIGAFKARLQDISPAAVEETRNMLRIIGYARNSEKIKQEASNAIETYPQALSWLSLDEGQPDDFVVTMFTVKVGEGEANRSIARKAVEIIADHRNSQKLKDWLITGQLDGSGEMDMGEAYALLNIDDRTAALDLENLQEMVNMVVEENPGSKEKYEKAFALICKDQQSNVGNLQNGSRTPRKKYPLHSWPVGCINIGNTCYLNSVLQYLFTVKPLRDMVLDCDNNLQETTPEALKTKRVGRSAVTAEKVEKAQQFVRELRNLFQRMITANTDRIRPETRLAALVLAKTDVVTTHALKTNANEAQLGHIGGLPVAGPMPPPGLVSEAIPSSSPADSVMGDDLSSKTDTSRPDIASNVDTTNAMDTTDSTDHQNHEAVAKPEPPSRPPPVPPRPQDLKKIEGLAEQQDAAEILNNVFDLLSCAFKGDGMLRDGEQYDLIKRLFFSDVATVRVANGKPAAPNIELQDNHLVSPKDRNRPLYAALDDEFSLSEVEGEPSQDQAIKKEKYEYITKASPIQIINVRRLVFQEGKTRKDESHVGLDEVLYLDRYLEKTDSLVAGALHRLREQQWQLQRKLKALESRKRDLIETELKATLSDVVDEAAALIEDINEADTEKLVDVEKDPVPTYTDLPRQLRERAHDLRKEAEILDGQMKELDQQINSIYQGCKDHPYRLHAVFMHRGSTTGGHYWIYIYDFQNKIWRDYNDEIITEVDEVKKKIFERDDNATSTGVIYVREELVDRLTEAVCRHPDPLPMQDVEMKETVTMADDYGNIPVIDGIQKE